MVWLTSMLLFYFLNVANTLNNVFLEIMGKETDDVSYFMKETFEGGYISCGTIGFHGVDEKENVLIAKYDGNGELVWGKSVVGKFDFWGRHCLETDNKDIIVAGRVAGIGTVDERSDVLLAKFSEEGNVVWVKSVGKENIQSVEVVELVADGFVVIGFDETGILGGYGYDILVSKFDSDGKVNWIRSYGGDSYDWGYGITTCADGGYVICGITLSFTVGYYDALIVKVDSMGEVIWSITIGGMKEERCNSVVEVLNPTAYVFSGSTNSVLGGDNYDIIVSKISESGSVVWVKTIRGERDEKSSSISTTMSGDGFVLTGYTTSFMEHGYGEENTKKAFILKIDLDGNLIFSRVLSSVVMNSSSVGNSIESTSDHGFVISGSIGIPRDMFFAKVDRFGSGCNWINASESFHLESWNEEFVVQDVKEIIVVKDLKPNVTEGNPLFSVGLISKSEFLFLCGVSCSAGYFGEDCTSYNCYSVSHNSDSVCGGNGMCMFPDDCFCDEGYEISDSCEVWKCGENIQTSRSVCSGRGECVKPGTCSCKFGWSGETCEVQYLVYIIIFPVLGIIFFSVITVCCICLCGVLLCFFVVFSLGLYSVCILLSSNIRRRKGIQKYKKLKHFDVLLQEQLLEEDKSLAHLKINKEMFSIPMGEVKAIKLIGKGGSNASVFLALWKNEKVAFKCFKTNFLLGSNDEENQHRFEDFEKELNLLANLSHPNIIRFFGASLKPPRVGLVMEFCKNGELLEFFEDFRDKNQKRYSLREKLRMCREVVSAMEYLHSRSITHRDLKQENILVDGFERTRLMDFGVSRRLNKSDSMEQVTVRIGTSVYMAPEVVSGSYDHRSDSYCFAILLYVIFTEMENPYLKQIENPFQIELKVANDSSFRPSLVEFRKIVFTEIEWVEKVMIRCWDEDKSKRYEFHELVGIFDKERVSDSIEKNTIQTD